MFDLSQNPFVFLGVTPRSSRKDINDACEDALLDAHSVDDERRVNLARQALSTPNERIAAELGYLLELRPAEARKALKGRGYAAWVRVAEAAHGLARANAFAEALGKAEAVEDAITTTRELILAWREIDVAETVRQINEERAVSGFGTVSQADVRRGLDALQATHADHAAASLERIGDLPLDMTALLNDELIPDGLIGDKFVTSLLSAYSRRTSGRLANAGDRTLASLKQFVETGSDDDFAAFQRDLSEWDIIAQPLQIVSEIKGADEPHSEELYHEVRRVALDLANNSDRHEDAARITQAAQRVFAELPSAKNQLRKDAEDLDDIIERASKTKLLKPLVVALADAGEDLTETSHSLIRYGFRPNAPDPVGAIRRNLDGTLSDDVPVEVRDMAASMVRSLAVNLFNTLGEIHPPQAITSFLVSCSAWFSEEVQARIAEDDQELSKNEAAQRLNQALDGGDLAAAKSACNDLLLLTSGDESEEFRKLAGVIDQRLQSRRNTRIFWGGLAAVVVAIMVFSESGSSNYLSDPEYAVADNVEMPADEAVSMPAAPAPLNEDQSELAPPPYLGGVLGLPQLRFCIRQGERLDIARTLVESSEQQIAFNSAVTDFNSRCGSFRYDEQDMSKVRSEIDQIRGDLRRDAQKIIGPKRTPVVPSYPYPGAVESEEPAGDPSTLDLTDPDGETDGY